MVWISFGALPCMGEKNLMTAHVSILLKSGASLTCFRACFLPGRAKDLSAPRYYGAVYRFKSWRNELFLPGRAKDLSAPRYYGAVYWFKSWKNELFLPGRAKDLSAHRYYGAVYWFKSSRHELVSFLVGLRTYQHPGTMEQCADSKAGSTSLFPSWSG